MSKFYALAMPKAENLSMFLSIPVSLSKGGLEISDMSPVVYNKLLEFQVGGLNGMNFSTHW